MTQTLSDPKIETIKVDGYDVPVRLAALTGCPLGIFESYGNAQFQCLQKYLNIRPHDFVLEIGCGAGRLAIPATHVVNASGGYLGIDIIEDSIRWCSENITRRYPHFRFHFEDVRSQIHNPAGVKDPASTVIPLPDGSVDRLFLSSVFTHMFPNGVRNYLREFRRVLKPQGIALSTMFLLNEGSRKAIQDGKTPFTFPHRYEDPEYCWVQTLEHPEGAVAYDEADYIGMIRGSGMELCQSPVYGTWSGIGDSDRDGQDYVVFGPSA